MSPKNLIIPFYNANWQLFPYFYGENSHFFSNFISKRVEFFLQNKGIFKVLKNRELQILEIQNCKSQGLPVFPFKLVKYDNFQFHLFRKLRKLVKIGVLNYTRRTQPYIATVINLCK